MRILLYIGIIIIGAWLGFSGKLPERFMGKLSKLQFASLLLLIFILGINIGVNDNVVSKFYKLSFQAFVIALFSIVFSIAFVKLVSGFVKQDEKESE